MDEKSNIWTVGFYANSNQVYQTLIEHWNGTNWSVVSSPNVGAGGNFLAAVLESPGAAEARP